MISELFKGCFFLALSAVAFRGQSSQDVISWTQTKGQSAELDFRIWLNPGNVTMTQPVWREDNGCVQRLSVRSCWVYLKFSWKKSDLRQVWKIPDVLCCRAAACVYASISQETLTRSGANESINSLKSGGEREFLCTLTNLPVRTRLTYLNLAEISSSASLAFRAGLDPRGTT